MYLTKGTLCGLPEEDIGNMGSTFPDSLRQSLINLCMSIWNMNSSQIVTWVADHFRGQVTESKHRGTEIISLMKSLRSFMSILGEKSMFRQLSNTYYHLRGGHFSFRKEQGYKNIKKYVIHINHQVLKSNSQLFLIVSRVPTIKKPFPRIHTIHYTLQCSLRKRLQCCSFLGWCIRSSSSHSMVCSNFIRVVFTLLCLSQFWLGQQNYEETSMVV